MEVRGWRRLVLSFFFVIVSTVLSFPEADISRRLKTERRWPKYHSGLFCICFQSHGLRAVRLSPLPPRRRGSKRDGEAQMKLLAGEMQCEHNALSTCFGSRVRACMRACMSLAALQTSAAKVKFQSVWNQSIEPAVEHPCLQLSTAPGHSDALLRPAESQYSQSSAALMHSLHSQVSMHVFSLTNVQTQSAFFFYFSRRVNLRLRT